MALPKLATRSWAVRRALAGREPFRTYGAFRAAAGGPASRGRLPDEWWAKIRDVPDGRIGYTVYSYVTPIAWVLDDGTVVIPPVRYSLTTTGHQGLLYALNQNPDTFPDDVRRTRAWTRPQPGSWDWPRAAAFADANGATGHVPSPRAPGAGPPARVSAPEDRSRPAQGTESVLDRIRKALAEADAQPPEELYFEGPETLLGAPDLAYSEAWTG
ncbi:hypothetical protein LO772_27350 [Yinghuangia sp. ASG 101]|uniref:hypothetical protein n=1 Tax=Yinghuangia sp. ASG 101 TaxID=2896848 RepID=UPI001E53A84F|nr:hypothetical protein [Yinghuangia sp. ASG 101]UGQ10531.1 hypothetical protein LO772_27350 [Yinghuangia sp. ASG 101]